MTKHTHIVKKISESLGFALAEEGGNTDAVTEGGSFEINGDTVPGAGTYTKVFNLSHSNFIMGRLFLYNPADVGIYKRAYSSIVFTTVLNECKAASMIKYDHVVSLCVFTNWWTRGYGYDVDSRLSDNYFRASGGNVRIKSCQIVDDTVELVFENTSSGDATVRVDGHWQVYAQ